MKKTAAKPDTGDPNVRASTWEEFANSGLMWWVNCQLNLFGWCIHQNVDGSIGPARTKYRGFPRAMNDIGTQALQRFMRAEAETIYQETCSWDVQIGMTDKEIN